ncbi:MAG: PilZ domain-containing protein [Dokdonella sp.]
MNEHRRAPRKSAYVTIPVANAMSGESMGRIGNLSSSGMLLVCNRQIADNALFQLAFELVDSNGRPHLIEVGVLEQWCEAANLPGQFWTGFQFIDVSANDLVVIDSWLGESTD